MLRLHEILKPQLNQGVAMQKITAGFVVQTFDDNGKFISQEFIENGGVDFEDGCGNPVEGDENLEHSFEMAQ